MRRSIITFLLSALALVAMAQVQVREQAPSQVIAGRAFRVQYTVNTTDVEDIQMGAHAGLDCLAGPYASTSISSQTINGQTTQSSSTTLTYTMRASAAGKFTIEPTVVTSGGKHFKSRGITIEVLPDAGSGDGCFVTVSASKTQVYEQEAVLVTFKVYSSFQPEKIYDDTPELNGCHLQEIGANQQKNLKLEHYKGRNYLTVIWRQYLVFPQQSGTITIPAVKYEVYGQQTVRSADPIDMFFGGGSMMREFKKEAKSPALEIKVKPLPTPRPANFSGAVGQFNISSSLTPQSLKVNDALTMRIVVSGTGNMKLIKAPTVEFPTDFETYDPKQEDKTKMTAQGLSGNKVFDYVAVPRHGGSYEVPAAQFCYFDPASGNYVTLSTDPYTVQVEKGSGGGGSTYVPAQKEDLKVLAEDIRFIKRGPTHPADIDGGFWGSLNCWLTYLVSMVCFAIISLLFRRQIKANADVARRRRRKAGSAATKRLKTARRLMSEGRSSDFYDEALKALWGYVADRLNIDVASLSRDNVAERLLANGESQAVVDEFLAVLSDLEFARYAPGDPGENMDKSYKAVEKVIMLI